MPRTIEHYLPKRLSELGVAVAISVPFSFGGPDATLAGMAVGGMLVLIGADRLPRLSAGLVIGIAIAFGYIFAALILGKPPGLVVGSSNHFLIYFYSLYVFQCAFLNGLFDTDRLHRYLVFLVVGHVMSLVIAQALNEVPGGGYFVEHTLLSLTTLFFLIQLQARSRRTSWLVAIALYLAFLNAGAPMRGSLVALSVLTVLLLWRPLPRIATPVLVLAIIFVPIALYLTLSTDELWEMEAADFNSYIRADFVRGAASLLREHLIFGVGFGEPFRPIDFGYISRHPLLTSWEDVTHVTNHHSVFDTFYRFGLVFGGLFFLAVFRPALGSKATAPRQLAAIYIAVGLSFNAWFENALQTCCIAFLIAWLGATRPPRDGVHTRL